MAASMSAEQILEQIFESDDELPEELSVAERLKSGLCSALKDGEVDKNVFLSFCTPALETFYNLSRIASEATDGHSKAERVLATHRVSTSTVLKELSRLWLNGIHRRLAQSPGSRNAFRGQISRDIPRAIFTAFLCVVRAMEGFCEPFCCYSNNKKTEVIRLASIRNCWLYCLAYLVMKLQNISKESL